jgi:hypothetical protein
MIEIGDWVRLYGPNGEETATGTILGIDVNGQCQVELALPPHREHESLELASDRLKSVRMGLWRTEVSEA